MLGIERIMALMASFMFSRRRITRRGRSTRRVRRALSLLRLPALSPIARLATLTITITKSRIFHPSRRYEFFQSTNPNTTIFIAHSPTNRTVITISRFFSVYVSSPYGSLRGLSIARRMLDRTIRNSMTLSNMGFSMISAQSLRNLLFVEKINKETPDAFRATIDGYFTVTMKESSKFSTVTSGTSYFFSSDSFRRFSSLFSSGTS
jgi:hypothetical protein